MAKTFRQRAAGALLDEYERAITDLKKVIGPIPDNTLSVLIDPNTSDENCQSIQTILSHVIYAGYDYATYINNRNGVISQQPARILHDNIRSYLTELDEVFLFTENVFKGVKEEELEQSDNALKMTTSWGQFYDIEQLIEHAIVHILRHRRQIENILLNKVK